MDANKNKPGVGSGLFGSTGNNIFGTPASKPSDQPGGSFGAPASFNASATASSTTPQSSPAKPSPFGVNLFGNPASGSTPIKFGSTSASAAPSAPKGSIFGGNPAAATASSNTPNIFSNSASNSTATAATGSFIPGMFGAKPSNPESSSTSVLTANPSSNPSSGPQSGLFGAPTGKTGSTGFFGNTTGGSGSPAPNAPNLTFSFGASSIGQQTKDSSNAKSIFGGGEAPKAPASTPILFGSKPNDQSNSSNAPVSTTNAATPTSQSTASTSSSGSPSLFAPTASSKTTTSHEPSAKPSSSLFSAPTSGGLSIKSTAPAKSSPLATNSSVPGESSQSTLASTSKAAGTPPATPSSKPNINLAPSLLKGKTLEDLVTRWNSELDERVEDFKHTANEIAAWDQVLIQNGDQISILYDELQRIEPMQSSIDQTLDFVEAQQQELLTALEEYERQLSSHQAQDFAAATGRTRTAAQEREEAYKTAEELHVQLNDMASSLGTMIAELNTLAAPGNRVDESSSLDGAVSSSSNEDPIVHIAGILNAHLGSLNWISEITQELGSKVNELESRISNTKVEFGLEPNPSNHTRQLEFNSEDFNPSLSSGGVGSLGPSSNFGHRISSGLLSHPRR